MSANTKYRESNIELLRIILMVMIIIGHANFLSIERPMGAEVISDASFSLRIFLQSLVEVAVDAFVFITGWYTIKVNKKGFFNLVFQVLFYYFGIFIIVSFFNGGFTAKELLDALDLSSHEWFVKSYICLYILSPVLNKFVESSTTRQIALVVFPFYIYAFIYGWLGGANRFFVAGYTPFSFIGIYLLAQYVKRNFEDEHRRSILINTSTPPIWYLVCYFMITLLASLLCIGIFYVNKDVEVYWAVHSYISPFMVIGATSLFLFFNRIPIPYSRTINYVAKSSFAAYLFHTEDHVNYYFHHWMHELSKISDSQWSLVAMVITYSLCVYCIVLMIDQSRIFIWKKISKIL